MVNSINQSLYSHATIYPSFSKTEWEEAFKNVMIRNTRQVEEQLLQQQHLQQQQQHHHQQVLQQQEEFLRMHELQKRNNFATNVSQINGPANGKFNFRSNL